ncbi:FAD-dependent oxidoreductase [Amnibacterium kyonggiense]|uniref:Ferredoxin-NADP reductase n=1 Tax=Amnibacterium kyonggiense TaxID=595671 RepID=A0A4R7FL72_9MICO|nr:oxidoreductase [Amnibacterium kyonggiense]TDS77151.1 ferredoxin-NADP reductase [Amnibacterium kyonggiense]
MTAPAPVRDAARPERFRTPGLLLDRLTGRVTMYRLVVLVLLAIALVAVVGSAVGLVPFPVLGLLASLVVAVVVGAGTNRLFALVRRIRPHTESGIITGLLAFFLFLPLPTAQALGALALAVAAANLSKYLLVVRGRHLVNPVAIGAVAVLLTRLSGATWWVGTPLLLPFVVIGGALVLRRAGAWDLALPMLLIAVPGAAIRLLAAGSPLDAAVWTALASSPYLFLGAFMLSEPLTAPPRRRQRILVSALVGVLLLIPLRIGWVGLTPEVALVLANLVAFGFGQRRRLRFVLEGREEHPGGIEELRFTSEAPLRIRPGQYVELSLPHARQDARGARRAFSPASAPGTAVRIVTRRAERSSSFKRALAAVPIGGAVAGSTVAGDFLPPRDPRTAVLWLASGVGVTPFLAMAETEPDRDAVLVWHLRAGDDPAWAAGALRRVRMLVVGPEDVPLPDGWERLGARLEREALVAAVPDLRERDGFVAGSPTWVALGRRVGRSAGMRRLRSDRFLGY